jgi:hypothetical protein
MGIKARWRKHIRIISLMPAKGESGNPGLNAEKELGARFRLSGQKAENNRPARMPIPGFHFA